MHNPFEDVEGNIQFPLNPTLDRIFLIPSPPPEKFEDTGLIFIPEQFREDYVKHLGIVLAVGPGHYNQKGKWCPVSPKLKPGSLVYYDITVPWRHTAKDVDGVEQLVVLCGASDILGIISY
jgi:co-chaperonin GroES (HSP10)